jgi:C4-dicarboxylate transporter DctM subunit
MTDTVDIMPSAVVGSKLVSLHPLDRLEAWCRMVTRPVAFIGVIGMLVVSGVTIVDVLTRWIFDTSIAATNEIISMTFAVAVAACIPAGLAYSVNLKVDLLESHLTGRWKEWLNAIGNILLGLFFAILCWRVMLFAADLHAQHRTTVILGWPQAPFMFATAALFAAGVAVQLVVSLNAARRALQPPAKVASGAPTPPIVKLFVLLIGGVTLCFCVVGVIDFQLMARFAQSNPGTAVTIACVLLWAILVAYVPLAAVMGLIGIVGTAMFIGFGPAMSVLATEVTGFVTNSNIAVLPLFLMMGSFAAAAGLADDAYELAHAVLRGFRGGLAMATIGGCAGFGAVTGSSVATAATIGRVALPEMRSRGYSPALATGCVAAGGTLGNLVPPGSGPLVLFALLTEASIGQLFIASVFPAVLVIAAYLLTVMIYVWAVPGAAPPATQRHPGEIMQAFRRCGPLTALVLVVMGGLYVGLFTITESAAVGAFGAFLAAAWRGKLKREEFMSVMAETTAVTAMIYTLIFGALVFAFFTEVTDLARSLTLLVSGLGLSPVTLVVLLLAVFIVLGTFMDSYAVMIATVPIVTPLVTGAGYDLVWWGIINLFVIEIGGISPPFGLNMFVLKTIDDVPMSTIYKGVTAFCVAAIITLAILVAFPVISLWLPSTMYQ